jgi:tetratricopeptide (TPR) repeat protein
MLRAILISILAMTALARAQQGTDNIPESQMAAHREWQRHHHSAQQNLNASRFPQAEQESLAAISAMAGFPANDRRRALSLNILGLALRAQARFSESEAMFIKTLRTIDNCEGPWCGLARAATLRNLALVYTDTNRLFDAEKRLKQALHLLGRADSTDEAMLRGGSVTTVNGVMGEILDSLSSLELWRNRPAAAEAYARRGLKQLTGAGTESPRSSLMSSLAAALMLARRDEEADAVLNDLEPLATTTTAGTAGMVEFYCMLAVRRSQAGDFGAAEGLLGRAQKLLPDELRSSSEGASLLYAYGHMRFLQKRYTEAEEWMNKGMPIIEAYWTQDHRIYRRSKEDYAAVLRKVGKKQEAKRVEAELRVGRSGEKDPGLNAINLGDLAGRSPRTRR